MVILLSDPGVEVPSSRTRSIATAIYGRLRKLSVYGSVRVVPPDRSFVYGYLIRWSSLGTGSLTSLLILQVFLATVTAILVALICRCIFGLTSGLSYLFGVLCSLDPLQLVWERYVMHE